MRLFRQPFGLEPIYADIIGTILIQLTPSTPPSNLLRATALSAALVALGTFGTSAADAAPVPNLTFDISARVTATGAGEGIGGQRLQARVMLHGNRTRVESTYAGQKSVTLIAPPYIYRLLPSSKAGVRWKLDGSREKSTSGLGLDPQELISNPGKIRALLVQNGAKRVGVSTLGGAAVDVYSISKSGEQISSAKAYLRKNDALPVKLEASGKGLKVSAMWSNYARPKDLPADLFRAPKDYKIREAKSAPPMSLLG